MLPKDIHLCTLPEPTNFTNIKALTPTKNDKTLYLKKIFEGIKAITNIKQKPKINLIKWFFAHGFQSLPAAEYKDATPTNPKNIRQNIITQFIFKNFEKKMAIIVSEENLLVFLFITLTYFSII